MLLLTVRAQSVVEHENAVAAGIAEAKAIVTAANLRPGKTDHLLIHDAVEGYVDTFRKDTYAYVMSL